jgi:hypothetical protein
MLARHAMEFSDAPVTHSIGLISLAKLTGIHAVPDEMARVLICDC